MSAIKMVVRTLLVSLSVSAFTTVVPSAGASSAPSGDHVVHVAPVAATVAPAETCSSETYVWNGTAQVGGGAGQASTGVTVPARLGTTMRVVSATSDGLDADGRATALAVRIGGESAAAGSSTNGGPVTVDDRGPTSLSASGAVVVIDRCSLVAQAGPPPGVPQAPVPSASPSSIPLPETGIDWTLIMAIGTGAVIGGWGLCRLGRTRPT